MNPWAAKPLCPRCNDLRIVTKDVRANMQAHVVPCPVCGADPRDKGPESNDSRDRYENFIRTRLAEVHKGEGLHLAELTPEEYKQFERWKAEHPKASRATILSWIEGGRYDPSKDEEFLAQCRAAMPTPEQQVEGHLGPTPEWLTRKLAGISVETNASQDAFFEAWKKKNP